MRILIMALGITIVLALVGPAILTLLVEGIFAVLVPLFVLVLLAGVGFLVGGVLLGSTFLGVFIALTVVFFVGFSIFWPLLLVVFLVWIFVRSRTHKA